MNNYAVSSDGIATALQDSASALMEGGNNLEQATALVAAANRVVQDPNSVGSALRTISLRLRGKIVPYCTVMYKLCTLKHSKDNYIGQSP